jgi:hypothetical protein
VFRVKEKAKQACNKQIVPNYTALVSQETVLFIITRIWYTGLLSDLLGMIGITEYTFYEGVFCDFVYHTDLN